MSDEVLVSAQMAPGGVIQQWLNDRRMTADKIVREFLDNSLDAGATTIEVSRSDREFCVRDDGIGCPEPEWMLSPGHTRPHHEGERSGFFGLGCKIAAIRASRGQNTKVVTIHAGLRREMMADWTRIIRSNRLDFRKKNPFATGERGTLIRCYGQSDVMEIRNPLKIADGIGFDYSDVIESGKKIVLEIDGIRIKVFPFSEPRFSERVDFEFEYGGETIRGYCGLVADGEQNPHPGWTFRRPPHRAMITTDKPAAGAYVGRIRGRVDLPPGWSNVNVTKDDFAEEPELLYRIIGGKCARIIEMADKASMDMELGTFTEAVVDRLNGLVLPFVKGRRERTGDKPGSIEPKGTDRRHQSFTKHQPGDKGFPKDPRDVPGRRSPQRFSIRWDANLPYSHSIQIPGPKGITAQIAINPSHPIPGALKQQKDPAGLAGWCLVCLASHICLNTEFCHYFGIYHEELNVNIALDKLIGRDGATCLHVSPVRHMVSAS